MRYLFIYTLIFASFLQILSAETYITAGFDKSPYQYEIDRNIRHAMSPNAAERAASAEALGFMRAYDSAGVLASLLKDKTSEVRRESALALGWCGSIKHLESLLSALNDEDWSVRQAAWVALTNITGMEFPFDAMSDEITRKEQIDTWTKWCSSIKPDSIPDDILKLLKDSESAENIALGCSVTASSTYKGPPSVLTSADSSLFWQTKNVPFPQHCTIDLGSVRKVAVINVEQYGPGYCMTDYAVSLSTDGSTFEDVCRKQEVSAPSLIVTCKPRKARYIRITSYASEKPTYPTTFYNVRAWSAQPSNISEYELSAERAMRAIGCMGTPKGVDCIIPVLETYTKRNPVSPEEKLMVQAGIRALGRISGEKASALLKQLLQNPCTARYAADALGDLGGKDAALALINAYPGYAIDINSKPPANIPRDDVPGFEAVDRMYETPSSIAAALTRLPLDSPEIKTELIKIAPLLVVNMAGDFDGAMIYEPQSFQLTTAYLLEKAGMREAVCNAALRVLARPDLKIIDENIEHALSRAASSQPGGTSTAAIWLTAFYRSSGNPDTLINLLDHTNGWVRINAAKTLMFNNEKSSSRAIANILAGSKPEAEFGYNGLYMFNRKPNGQDEYNAPSPCWREAFTRALGILGGETDVPLLIKLLNDDQNVLEVQYAAAISLDKLGSANAITELQKTYTSHPFHSIRLVAREALWKRNLIPTEAPAPAQAQASRSGDDIKVEPGSIVFIKGSNNMPNDFQIDPWRQTYSTTDSGPTYRPGTNLYVFTPSTDQTRAITTFDAGYVADCEVSWDGKRILFSRRGGDSDPWWHIYEIYADGSGLHQVTSGPYHDVQPAYLPDERIVFASSRAGTRDEYHGYPATGLTIMNSDGNDIHCIGFNLGRDNEPSIMTDGRILFSRLELFYSRLKTEITLQSVFPDGTKNITLYGPERRDFWRNITMASKEGWWGEAPPRHRVLRMTQAQALDQNRIICATTGGATIAGPGRFNETIIPRWNNMAVTTPFPIDDNQVMCSATVREFDRTKIDLGIYMLNTESGELNIIYNDPGSADYEARPLSPRKAPPMLPGFTDSTSYTARLLCNSALTSQEAITRKRGKLVRIVEGQPIPSRHHTHTSTAGEAWKNHVGTQARVLGTVPLAPDGSFFVEIPADRLIHCQVLDSDRRVVGNQLIWMYARPNETKSCVGCHEIPDSAPLSTSRQFPESAKYKPLQCLPSGGEFLYRAKAWFKGAIKPEIEERTRTVNAINLPGRM